MAPRRNPPGCAGRRVCVGRDLGLHPPVVPAGRGHQPRLSFSSVRGRFPSRCWSRSFSLSYTRLVRWANEAMTFVVLVIGLNFIWVMSTLYGTVYGTVSLAALAMAFIAMVMRLRTVGDGVPRDRRSVAFLPLS